MLAWRIYLPLKSVFRVACMCISRMVERRVGKLVGHIAGKESFHLLPKVPLDIFRICQNFYDHTPFSFIQDSCPIFVLIFRPFLFFFFINQDLAFFVRTFCILVLRSVFRHYILLWPGVLLLLLTLFIIVCFARFWSTFFFSKHTRHRRGIVSHHDWPSYSAFFARIQTLLFSFLSLFPSLPLSSCFFLRTTVTYHLPNIHFWLPRTFTRLPRGIPFKDRSPWPSSVYNSRVYVIAPPPPLI